MGHCAHPWACDSESAFLTRCCCCCWSGPDLKVNWARARTCVGTVDPLGQPLWGARECLEKAQAGYAREWEAIASYWPRNNFKWRFVKTNLIREGLKEVKIWSREVKRLARKGWSVLFTSAAAVQVTGGEGRDEWEVMRCHGRKMGRW